MGDSENAEYLQEEDKKQQKIQQVGKSFRVQVAHPLRPGERLSISGKNENDVKERADHIRRIKWQYEKGIVNDKVVKQIIEREYRPITVHEIWTNYVKTKPEKDRAWLGIIWQKRLAPTFEKKMAFELDEGMMRIWEQEQRKEVNESSIRTIFDRLQAAYNLDLKSSAPRLDGLPWKMWRPKRRGEKGPKREACRSLEELERLIVVARKRDEKKQRKGYYSDLAYRVLVIALCGLRQGEASGLGWDCIHMDAEEMAISGVPWIEIKYQASLGWSSLNPRWMRPIDPPKDGPRNLALHPSVVSALKALREYQQQRGLWQPNGPVFPAPNGQWRARPTTIGTNTMRQLVKEADLPNVEKWVTHSLRHTFATLEVIASRGDLRSTRERTGHSTVKQLEAYLHAGGRGMPSSALPMLRTAPISPNMLDTYEAKGEGEILEAVEIVEKKPQKPTALLKAMAGVNAALVDLTKASTDQAKKYEEQRVKRLWEKRKEWREKKQREAENKPKMSMTKRAEEWLNLPDIQKGVRPEAVTAWMDKKYQSAYHKEFRRSGDAFLAKKEGNKARGAAVRTWKRTLTKAAEKLGKLPKMLELAKQIKEGKNDDQAEG